MTSELPGWRRAGALAALAEGRALPVLTLVLLLVLAWYAAAIWLNAPFQIDRFADAGTAWSARDLIAATWSQERPVLPAPHQVLAELQRTVLDVPMTSRRSLVAHAWVTLSSTLAGFVLGTISGILLAVGIVHSRTLQASLMPWIVASQTIPILAIAPIVVVVMGSFGILGLLPKAVISAYLCFFPVAIGMVKGLTSPDPLQRDLLRTYDASAWQTFWKLRWPAAVPFLMASLKVGVGIALVGAIVAELPTGAQAGLGARLLAGSYYGQTVQIWAALLATAVLASLLVALIGLAERLLLRGTGRQT